MKTLYIVTLEKCDKELELFRMTLSDGRCILVRNVEGMKDLYMGGLLPNKQLQNS